MSTEVKVRLTASSRELIGTTEKFVRQYPTISVTNTQERDDAIKITKEVKKFAKDLDQARAALVKPLNDRVKAINEHFKSKVKALTDLEGIIKSAITAFNAAEEEKQRQALEAIAKLKAEAPAEIAEQVAIVSAANLDVAPLNMVGAHTRRVYVTEVTDKKAFVKWCLDNDRLDLIEINSAGLQVLGNMDKENTNIPGIKVVPNETLVIR